MSKSAQTSPLHDLTAFQRDLLAVLEQADEMPHGLGIREELHDAYGTEITHGRLYQNLDTLVEKGLVEKGAKDKRTNEYRITARGERELAADHKWRKSE